MPMQSAHRVVIALAVVYLHDKGLSICNLIGVVFRMDSVLPGRRH